MSKRNISYVKPQDPSFLTKLKAEIGYKEGPTIDTKKQKLEAAADSDSGGEERPEREDEKPQIVVLQSGDLSADEVALEEKRIAREQAEEPADLSKPIVFQKRNKDTPQATTTTATKKGPEKSKSKEQKPPQSRSKLSFDAEAEDEE